MPMISPVSEDGARRGAVVPSKRIRSQALSSSTRQNFPPSWKSRALGQLPREGVGFPSMETSQRTWTSVTCSR